MLEFTRVTKSYYIGRAACIGLNKDENPAYTLVDFSVWVRIENQDLDVTAILPQDVLRKAKESFLTQAKGHLRDPWEVDAEKKQAEAEHRLEDR